MFISSLEIIRLIHNFHVHNITAASGFLNARYPEGRSTLDNDFSFTAPTPE